MTAAEPPKIEFPCAYPIKIFLEGDDESTLDSVYRIVGNHAAEFDAEAAQLRPSRNGRFLSVSVEIIATGEPQLKALHEELIAHPQVRLVL